MLTSKDISSIGKLLDERVPRIIDDRVPKIIENMVPRIIDERVPKIIQKELAPIKKDIKKIYTLVKQTTDFLDREILNDRKRIEKLEKEVKLQKDYI